jgi:hypothetical protein
MQPTRAAGEESVEQVAEILVVLAVEADPGPVDVAEAIVEIA